MSILFLVLVVNFDQLQLLWSYMLLLKPPVLMCSWHGGELDWPKYKPLGTTLCCHQHSYIQWKVNFECLHSKLFTFKIYFPLYITVLCAHQNQFEKFAYFIQLQVSVN